MSSANVYETVKWWRVVDPLNPLCGCDVRLGTDDDEVYNKIAEFSTEEDGTTGEYVSVTALRKLDVLVGNRPFQLVNRDGDIGLLIDRSHIEPSPVQDDVVEIGYDLPNGRCVDETVIEGIDGDVLRVATYERAIQVAYCEEGDDEGEMCATATLRGDDRAVRFQNLVLAFKNPDYDHHDVITLIKGENY